MLPASDPSATRTAGSATRSRRSARRRPTAAHLPHGHYLLVSNGNTDLPSSTGEVLVTTDGGASWRRSVVQAGVVLTDMACPTVDECWVAGPDGIFATADGGETW